MRFVLNRGTPPLRSPPPRRAIRHGTANQCRQGTTWTGVTQLTHQSHNPTLLTPMIPWRRSAGHQPQRARYATSFPGRTHPADSLSVLISPTSRPRASWSSDAVLTPVRLDLQHRKSWTLVIRSRWTDTRLLPPAYKTRIAPVVDRCCTPCCPEVCRSSTAHGRTSLQGVLAAVTPAAAGIEGSWSMLVGVQLRLVRGAKAPSPRSQGIDRDRCAFAREPRPRCGRAGFRCVALPRGARCHHRCARLPHPA